jgi:hypothetical protein
MGCEMGSDPWKTLMQHTHMLQQQQRKHKGACLFLQDLITLRLEKKKTHSVETRVINPYIRNRKMPQTSALVFSKISKKRSYDKELMHTHMLQQQWKHKGACTVTRCLPQS